MKCLKQIGNDTLVTVKVKTRQSVDLIFLENEEIIIYVKEPPVKNRANKKIINLMRKQLGNPVSLEYGQNTSIKTLRVNNINPKRIIEILG
jgi:uncharacterized protein (TIGR00251 family)